MSFKRGILFATIGCAAMLASVGNAEEPVTFTKDILPIMQENCQGCHRPLGANLSGMIAPMSLTTYQEVRPWAKAIARAVESREMPPWHASEHTNGVFRNERTLTDEEIQTILTWVDTGAKRGNPTDAPAPLEVPDSPWQISQHLGEPDLVFDFPEPYWVGDDVIDVQPEIPVKITREMLPEKRWVQAIEFKPGSEIVHHIVGQAVPPGEVDNGANRTNFGQIASGSDPQFYDEGYGLPLEPESTVILSMHYNKEPGPGTGQFDNSQTAVWFHDEEVKHELESSPIAHRKFEIPPGVDVWRVGGVRTWDDDFRLLELAPHTHLRGVAARYTAVYPDGTSELLLDVDRYDYNWQTQYRYEEYKDMPAGTRIEWEVWFSNTEELAAERDFNPDRAIRFGLPTKDEMDLGWVTWCYAEEGKKPDSSVFSENELPEATGAVTGTD